MVIRAPPLLQHNGFHASPCGRESGDFLFISENGLKYRVREANKQDITSLNACNRQNLPENYNDEFYENQLTRWSSISLIAENEKEVVSFLWMLFMVPLFNPPVLRLATVWGESKLLKKNQFILDLLQDTFFHLMNIPAFQVFKVI
jgi:ribosomal protein S18 acetylase RimI-like enzyme